MSKTSAIFVLGGSLLCGCGEKPAAPPPVASAISASVAPIQAPPLPAPGPAALPAPAAASNGAKASTVEADSLATLRTDVNGKAVSDLAIVQQAVDGYNATRVRLEEPDSKPGPPLTDLNQLVALRRLPKLPATPAGQKFILDQKTQKVSLVSQ